MFISENQARAFRHKRADMMLTKTELAKKDWRYTYYTFKN